MTSPVPPWEADIFPGRFYLPTMLTGQEINYLHWLSHNRYQGAGRVVELGCFLGGSTLALAQGLSTNPKRRGKLLTYDSFIMDASSATMHLQPYQDAESFRPLFDLHLRRHLSDIKVVEGWIPADLPPKRERELYPEQEPIEVLFVDAAKHWLVHSTILRCFGRHLIPGKSVLVQQDFKHFYVYWIPLHMHQLRDCFEPAHDIPHSATIAFRYKGGIESKLDALLKPDDIPPDRIGAAWDEVEEFWERQGSPHALATVRLNRVMHLADAGRIDEALASLEQYLARSRRERLGSLATILRAEFAGVSGFIAARLGPETVANRTMLARLRSISEAVSGDAPAPEADRAAWLQQCLWRHAAQRCLESGARRIALYGAGRHTLAMLRSGWPGGELRVIAIVDDFPKTPSIEGVPVMLPRKLPRDVDAVVVSSDLHEKQLAEAAERAFSACNMPIILIYQPAAREPAVV